MNPGQAAVLAQAKAMAQPYVNAVRSRSAHHETLLTAGLSWDELHTLTVLLAEVADDDLLALVCAADDGGTVPARKAVA